MKISLTTKTVKRVFLFTVFVFFCKDSYSQYNSTWLISYNNWVNKLRITYNANNYTLIPETRKMGFQETEATISDANGNFLMSSNGVWIADATGDTMMNGKGLNPGAEVNAYPDGLLLNYANIILPYPGDTTKYVLFHHTCNWDGTAYPAYEVFYTVIDMTQNGGLGGVDSLQKNAVAFQDTLNWGLAACRHANGRDWWIIAQKHNTSTIYKILFTPTGIASVTSQNMNVPKAWYNTTQPTFSLDGNHFAYYAYVVDSDTTYIDNYALLFDFDRCSGMFSNSRAILVTTLTQNHLWGLAFSPSGDNIYTCTSGQVYQINTNTLSVDTIATYDGYYSPYTWCCATTFWEMYLAANGKIYITSGSGVQHIHEMNYPDSAGVACDLQQHAINLGVWSFRAVPNHPNYYLGCDTTSGCPCLAPTGLNEIEHDFRFKIMPNPSNGNFKIMYLLPQNSRGTFEVFDITGKKVFSYSLPQWSTLQNFDLSFLNNGIYYCLIRSGNYVVSKKLAIIH